MEDFIEIEKLNEIHCNSYIKKEEFMKMLENLRFVGIEKASLHFITGFEYNAKENITKTRGYDIELY